MGVLILEKEITTSIPSPKLFKVFVLESDKIIPKIVPHVSIELLEGNGGPGTIRKTTFSSGDIKYIKSKIEATDKDNFTHSYAVIGGEPWMDELEKVCHEIKIEAASDGGSICKSSTKYYPKEGQVLNEEIIKARAEKAFGMYKAIEAYLLANPDAFN